MELIVLLVIAGCFQATDAEITFSDTSATATLAESVPTGTSVYKASATGGTNISYTLTEGEATSDHFEIEAASGLVKTKASLDFETKTSYTLKITATAEPSSTATIDLSVMVTNVVPTFTRSLFTETINNGSTAGTVLGTYEATDPGETPLTYSIVTGNTDTDFNIDNQGVIKVADGKTLSKLRTATYTLVLHAADKPSGGETGSATVSVSVRDGTESGTAALSASLMALVTWVFAYLIKGR